MINKKFGFLTVIERVSDKKYPSGSSEPQYLCQCICGRKIVKEGRALRNAKTDLSCGCIYKNFTCDPTKDLVGEKYGHLLVINKVNDKDKWECLCDCGNKKIFTRNQLESGCYKSCGCQLQSLKDLTNQKFGKLTVLYRDKNDKTGHTKWVCKCECGKIVSVYRDALLTGRQVSCGCYKSELMKSKEFSESRRILNKYDLSETYGIGYCTNSGNKFYFDKEDYELINKYTWRDDANGYIVASTNPNHDNTHCILLHRLVMGLLENDEFEVDHIGHNTYDNRKQFLRVVSHSENESNRVIMKNNTSGVPGVSWDKRRHCWSAYICKNNERIKLGDFSDFEKAVSIRKSAEEKYFGDYSLDNSMNIYSDPYKILNEN